jgi:hypothetical protein
MKEIKVYQKILNENGFNHINMVYRIMKKKKKPSLNKYSENKKNRR